ncbi:MAG: periplasmic protein TonB [Desulfuromonadales bacterium]|nr:periplasmic protein TonB [Desulfuromonadales bacterium]
MSTRRTWVALGISLTIHLALVVALGMGLVRPHRLVNRIEVDLEGATVPSAPPGVAAPSPVAGPEMPNPASLPATASVSTTLTMPVKSMATPQSTRYDPDGEMPTQEREGPPGPTHVALTASGGAGGGPGGSGNGSGPGRLGGGRGRSGSGSGSALAGYLHAIRQRVDAAKRYPQMAQQRRQEGVVVVTFRLTVDGRLVDEPVLTRSSGYRQLDAAALRAVSKGAPYPRFPMDPALMKDLVIPVKFYLR